MNISSGIKMQANINMTPMIDVLLVLLIIFMAIAPTKSAGLSALVPQSQEGENQRPPEAPVVLEIADDGSYRVNTRPMSNAELGPGLEEIYSRRGDRVLFVKAAPGLDFSAVAAAIDVAHDARVERIALMPR